MSLVHDGRYQVFKVAGMGPYDNNGYVIADPGTKEAYIVDAPAEFSRLLDAAKDFHVKGVVVTHTHPDHIAGYGDLKKLTDLPVGLHEADAPRLPGRPDFLLADGDDLRVGQTRLRVLHTPGHTPGGICLHGEGTLISGDTLFPGGPGYTGSAGDFRQVVRSITERLLVLDDATLVLPGHGADTTVGAARREYQAFAAKAHPPDLHGHVSWMTS
jgi:hydroxyacylglutathione hydrolase